MLMSFLPSTNTPLTINGTELLRRQLAELGVDCKRLAACQAAIKAGYYSDNEPKVGLQATQANEAGR